MQQVIYIPVRAYPANRLAFKLKLRNALDRLELSILSMATVVGLALIFLYAIFWQNPETTNLFKLALAVLLAATPAFCFVLEKRRRTHPPTWVKFALTLLLVYPLYPIFSVICQAWPGLNSIVDYLASARTNPLCLLEYVSEHGLILAGILAINFCLVRRLFGLWARKCACS